MAGYEKEMKGLFKANPGFKSRVPFTFNFEDYTCPQLREIGSFFLDKAGMHVAPPAEGVCTFQCRSFLV